MTTPPRRRWFRFAFSLRALFVVITMVGVWLGWNLKIVRERKAVLAEIRRVSPNAEYVGLETSETTGDTGWMYPGEGFSDYEYQRISFVRKVFGDESCHRIFLPTSLASDWIVRAEYAFPEAELYMCKSGTWFVDEFRDSLYTPADRRAPNTGAVFETGLVEQSSVGEDTK